jgi:hypothetical protein
VVAPPYGLEISRDPPGESCSQAQRRIPQRDCKDYLTVFRRSDAIPEGENERLPAIGRRIGENPDLLLLEDAPRHSLCAVLMTRRLNLVLKTVN